MKTKHKSKPKPQTRAVVKRKQPETLSLPEEVEQSLIEGNLANLTPEKRVMLYMATCKSLRLNPLTKPFCFILVSDWENSTEKLILYAAKNCTDQLRAIYGITTVPGSLKQWREEGMLKASISMRMKTGRTDSDIAVIPMERYSRKHNRSYTLSGAQLANAEMHVVTKAKRRTTLSLCGLGGIVDESELDTMKVIGGTTPDGRIFRYQEERDDQPPAEPRPLKEDAPHGHAPGSDKAKQAEAALKRVEEADAKLKEGVPGAAWKADTDKKADAPPPKPAEGAKPAGELTVTQVGELFEISGAVEVMNEHRGLLLHYGKRKDKVVVMDAEALNAFTYQFVDLRGGKLIKGS